MTQLKDHEKELEYFREAMGVLQHHDAVSGTEKQLVANDYARILYNGMEQGTNIAYEALRCHIFLTILHFFFFLIFNRKINISKFIIIILLLLFLS